MPRQPTYHVVPSGKDWAVKQEGNNTPLVTTDNKAEAVQIGKQFAKGAQGQVMIHDRDGGFQTEHTYGHDPESRKS